MIKDIPYLRMQNQLLHDNTFKSAVEVVRHMGAMQAQDYPMSLWAAGVRIPESSATGIEASLNSGQILRTHVLRPTWHLVTPENIYWMLELSAPQIKGAMKSMNIKLELTDTVFSKCNRIIEKALSDGSHLTRDEIMRRLEKSKINTGSFRSAHIMLNAELEGIVCSGAVKGKKQTYTLLPRVAPRRLVYPKEESLARLARTYIKSHGPVTVQDFAWWSGLKAGDARRAFELVKGEFESAASGSKTFLHHPVPPSAKNKSVYLLPAYDEYLISYKDRSAIIHVDNLKQYQTVNGIFQPSILVNGQVTGTWKRSVIGETVTVELCFYKSPPAWVERKIKKAVTEYATFIGKVPEWKHR